MCCMKGQTQISQHFSYQGTIMFMCICMQVNCDGDNPCLLFMESCNRHHRGRRGLLMHEALGGHPWLHVTHYGNCDILLVEQNGDKKWSWSFSPYWFALLFIYVFLALFQNMQQAGRGCHISASLCSTHLSGVSSYDINWSQCCLFCWKSVLFSQLFVLL